MLLSPISVDFGAHCFWCPLHWVKRGLIAWRRISPTFIVLCFPLSERR